MVRTGASAFTSRGARPTSRSALRLTVWDRTTSKPLAHGSCAAAYPTFFLPFLQIAKEPKLGFMMSSHYIGDIELRVAGEPQNLEGTVRRTLADIDLNLNVLEAVSLSEQLARNFNQDRLIARLTELFGLLTLIPAPRCLA